MSSVEQVIERSLEAATAAPSLFNAQPWRLRTVGSTVLVCADRSRSLPVHDPDDRELLIACGAFTMFVEIGLRAAGLPCVIEPLPEPTSAPDVVAALQVGRPAPGASPDEDACRLAAVMDRTQHDRRPFTAVPVTSRQIAVLRRAAEAEGAWLLVLDDDRWIEAAVLHSYADELLRADQQAAAELARWVRRDGSHLDGVPIRAVGVHSDTRACSFSLRAFDTPSRTAAAPAGPPVPERPVVALLGTAHDRPDEAVTAGRALGRVLLEAAASGLAASPLNQALQTATRWRLAATLSLTGTPQYQLRIGTPAGPPPELHRRPLTDLLLRSG